MKLDEEERVTLLGHYLSILPPRWSQQQTYIAVYLTLNSSIIGFTVLALEFLSNPLHIAALLVSPMLVIVLSQFAKTTIKRQSRHIRELIVFIGKLEYELGLYSTPNVDDDKRPWPEDKFFLTPKWVESRHRAGRTSEAFINASPDGTAQTAVRIFTLLQIVGLAAATAIGAALIW